jgi:hypothetical protein
VLPPGCQLQNQIWWWSLNGLYSHIHYSRYNHLKNSGQIFTNSYSEISICGCKHPMCMKTMPLTTSCFIQTKKHYLNLFAVQEESRVATWWQSCESVLPLVVFAQLE